MNVISKLNGFHKADDAVQKRTFALDLPTSHSYHSGYQFLLGWTFRAADSSVIYGTQAFGGKSTEGAGKRLLRFRYWLEDMCAEVGPDAIFFKETPWFPVFHSFAATLTAFCEEHKIPYRGVSPGAVKRLIAGDSHANKLAVFKAVTDLGYKPEDDNQAGALAILLFAESLAEARSQTWGFIATGAKDAPNNNRYEFGMSLGLMV